MCRNDLIKSINARHKRNNLKTKRDFMFTFYSKKTHNLKIKNNTKNMEIYLQKHGYLEQLKIQLKNIARAFIA